MKILFVMLMLTLETLASTYKVERSPGYNRVNRVSRDHRQKDGLLKRRPSLPLTLPTDYAAPTNSLITESKKMDAPHLSLKTESEITDDMGDRSFIKLSRKRKKSREKRKHINKQDYLYLLGKSSRNTMEMVRQRLFYVRQNPQCTEALYHRAVEILQFYNQGGKKAVRRMRYQDSVLMLQLVLLVDHYNELGTKQFTWEEVQKRVQPLFSNSSTAKVEFLKALYARILFPQLFIDGMDPPSIT